jgi:tRNA dimethylallyltransferase
MSRVLFLLGPTGIGKSALAVELASATGAEIVNADAFQMYRGLDIGTAKPAPEVRQVVPHHLFDVLDPTEICSAGKYARLARETVEKLGGQGKPVIITGGTGFYIRALREGLNELPEVPPDLRAELRNRLKREGLSSLREELRTCDPVTWARVHPQDTQRILRALEIYRASGTPWSEWLRVGKPGFTPLRAEQRGVRLTCSRALLYDQLSARLDNMIAGGWVEEVKRLLSQGVTPEAPAFRAIGYREWVEYLEGRWSFEQARARVLHASRHYAKRQETWFRRETWLEPVAKDRAHEELRSWIRWLTCKQPQEKGSAT